MKTIRFKVGVVFVGAVLSVPALAQDQETASSVPTFREARNFPISRIAVGAIAETSIGPNTPVYVQDSSVVSHLDNAVAALNKGDKSMTTQELQAGITGMETAAQAQPTSFKDKLLSQAGKLKALLPLIPTGALGNGVLGKAVSLAKLAAGGNQLEGILAAGSLLGKGSQLTSGLTGISSALSGLGGATQSSGKSLVSSAMAAVGKLNQGGIAAQAAEPVAKTEISSLLNLVKGAI